MAAETAAYHWHGQTRSGDLQQGVMTLTVSFGDRTVAAIERRGDRPYRRTWWAETPQAGEPQ